MNSSVDIQVTADVSLDESLNHIAGNFLTLYEDKWFLAAILIAFFAGQVTHAILRGYCPQVRDLTKALFIWTAQLLVGYIAAIELVESADEIKLAYLTGINSIIIYYLLLWVSTRWFKFPRFAKFLTLRDTKVNDEGEIDFGATIQFLRKKNNDS